MKRMLAFLLLGMAIGACVRHKPRVDQTHPFAQEQQQAKDVVEARGRYDVNHNPNDTMSVNTMGSD